MDFVAEGGSGSMASDLVAAGDGFVIPQNRFTGNIGMNYEDTDA